MPGLLGNINLDEYLLTTLIYFIFTPIRYTPANMKKFIVPVLIAFLTLGAFTSPEIAHAQSARSNSVDLSAALSRLQNNPRYYGRVLGTHLRKSGRNYVYEVRILRPDDSVVIVFISPKTGGVIGDSERSSGKSRSKKQKKKKK